MGAAAVVLLILGLNLRRAPERRRTPPPNCGDPGSRSEPAVGQAKPPAAAVANRSAPERSQPPAGKGMWRVIAFTYRTGARPRRQIRSTSATPGSTRRCFRRGKRKATTWSLWADRMSREDAVRLQKKAQAEGLARDMYVQNYLD